MNVLRSLPQVVLGMATLAATASSQTITTVIKTGDNVPGVGNVTLVRGLAVSDNGEVRVHVFTDNPMPVGNGAVVDGTGTPVIVEAQSLTEPSGAILRSFAGGEIDLSASGESTYLLWLDGTSGTDDDEGLYWGSSPDLAVLEGGTATAPGLTAGSTYPILLPPHISDTGEICFHSIVDDPGISGTFDIEALIVHDLATGVERVVVKEGDMLAGQNFPVDDLTWGWNRLSFNNVGEIMYSVGTSGPSDDNSGLYIDDTLIVKPPQATPFGSTMIGYSYFDMNDNGDHAVLVKTNNLNASDGILLNGAAFIQDGDPLPALAPYNLKEVSHPIRLGNDGTLLWVGVWQLPDGSESVGVFIDYTLIAGEGVTVIDSLLVEDVFGLDRSAELSDSGQYLLFEAVLEGGIEGAFLVDLWQ